MPTGLVGLPRSPLDITVVVDPAGSFPTIDDALREVSRLGFRRSATIELPEATIDSDASSSPRTMNFPHPLGSLQAGAPLDTTVTPPYGVHVKGKLKDTLALGARTAAVVTAGVSPTFSTIQEVAGGLVVNALKGFHLVPLTGAQIGKKYLIVSNTADTVTLCGQFAVSQLPVAGDTYEYQKPVSILRWPSASLRVVNIAGGPVLFENVEFDLANPNGNFGMLNVVSFVACTFGNGSGSYTLVVSRHTAQVRFGLSTRGGCYFKLPAGSAVHSLSAGNAAYDNCTFDAGCSVSASGCSVSMFRFDGAPVLSFTRQSKVLLGIFQIDSSAGGVFTRGGVNYQGCIVVEQSDVDITNGNITNSIAPADAVVLLNGTRARIAALTGAGNAGVGIRAHLFSRCQLETPGTAVTVTGAGGDTIVGANGVKTYAQINAGAAADVTDTVELVRVSK